MNNIERIPELVSRLYEIVAELENLFPGRRFTPDGHLVGSIGEALACHHYDLEPLAASQQDHDARAKDGRLVQIKITQRRNVGLRGEPQHLVVLQLEPDGTTREVFNGPGDAAWEAAGPRQRNGQKPISTARLRDLMTQVEPETKLCIIRPFPD